jgi:hypothetical protein
MQEFIVYQKGNVRVYIHECEKPKNRKMPIFAIRRDDNTGLAAILGLIRFCGRWRQYVTEFEPYTRWSSGCKRKICEFEDNLNLSWRKGLSRKVT